MMTASGSKLVRMYEAMQAHYGPIGRWWPTNDPLEIMIGAVLVQNTNWANVEKAMHQLRQADVIDPQALDALAHDPLAELIRPSGYRNVKARRLKNLVRWLVERFDGSVARAFELDTGPLREELVGINGVGLETADSILLYAADKLTFVVDTYTYRVLRRHELVEQDCDYEGLKQFCEDHLPADLTVYQQCHGYFVEVGKQHCRPKPRCEQCPLRPFLPAGGLPCLDDD